MPDDSVMTKRIEELRTYINQEAHVADANSKEWAEGGDKVNAAYRAGMWYAYNDVRERLP